MSIKKIACAIIFLVMLLCTFIFAGGIGQFIDLAAASVVIVLGALFAFSVHGEGSYIRKFGDGCARAGWIGTLIGAVVIFGGERFAAFNVEEIGPAVAVTLLSLLYGYSLKMLSMIVD
ncbi:MAG: hypothetical protein VYE27_09505 [Pseudomonadota bacterium]|nr:hypothetical protein [Pseudomonadota bacterium]